jgi:hypothetical protein
MQYTSHLSAVEVAEVALHGVENTVGHELCALVAQNEIDQLESFTLINGQKYKQVGYSLHTVLWRILEHVEEPPIRVPQLLPYTCVERLVTI